MIIPSKKLKNGFSIPEFGVGTWEMGGRRERDDNNDDSSDITSLQTAIRMGVKRIDTAELYGLGKAEELVGQAIKEFDRKTLFITSKVFLTNLKHDQVLAAAEKSLKRLETNYFDLYLVHAHDAKVPLKETFSAMDELVDAGIAKNIGVCNFSLKTLKEAMQIAEHDLVLNQVHYNLIYREPELTGLLEFCQENDVILEAWRPTEKGILAQNGIEIVNKMCVKYGKTPVQIAINWLLSQKNVITLAKSRSLNHLKENLRAIGWKMTREDVELLRQHYPGQKSVSDAVPLG